MKTLGWVLGHGARTPIGLDVTQTGFMLRTGIPVVGGAPLAGPGGDELTMAFDPTLDPYTVGEERCAELAASALREAVRPLGSQVRTLKVEVILSLEEPHGEAVASGLLGSRLKLTLRDQIGDPPVEVAMRGGAGPLPALASALGRLERHQIDLVIFGGVLSDYDPVRVAYLDALSRIYSPKNLDALIPGESAAFVAIGRRELASRLGLSPLGRIHGLGTGFSEATAENARSAYASKGLAESVRDAARDLPEEMRVGWTLCDHTFELRRIYEWQNMLTRARQVFGAPHVTDAPAQRLGHVGAAALPLFVALACEGFVRGYAPHPLAMCFAGSDSGERAAIMVGSP